MGRRREITEDQSKVLAELGHTIHFYYDPAEPLRRVSKVKFRTNGALKPKPKKTNDGRGRKSTQVISLTSVSLNRVLRDSRKSLAKVYDTANMILLGTEAKQMNRGALLKLIMAETGLSKAAINCQFIDLFKGKQLHVTDDG